MSTVISEGIPVDGFTTRIFEPPQVNQNNTRPRYLTFLASFITPQTAAERPWTRGGGIEVANPCLRYAKNHLRKGRITPLLKDVYDWMPYDLVKKTMDSDPLSSGWFAQQIPAGYVPPNLPPPNGQGMLGAGAMGGASPYGMMIAKLALPGQQIDAILHGDDNVSRNFGRKGVVEFTELIGHDYRPQNIGGVYVDPTIWDIQRAIFPDYPNLPVKIDDLEVLLDAAPVTLQWAVDKYRESLSEFRSYADIYIQNVHQSMRERAPNGYVRPYTATDLVILDQLGMERQDRAPRTQIPVGDSRTEQLFQQFMELQIAEKQANLDREKRLEAIGQLDANTISASSMAAAPITNATPLGQEQITEAIADTEPKTYICEHCNEEVKWSGKGFHVGRHCKVLHPKDETPNEA